MNVNTTGGQISKMPSFGQSEQIISLVLYHQTLYLTTTSASWNFEAVYMPRRGAMKQKALPAPAY
jgi:hypothetical protein